jgi:hypothetical protein
MAAAAKEEHVAIIATGDDQFTASWKIAKLLKLVATPDRGIHHARANRLA